VLNELHRASNGYELKYDTYTPDGLKALQRLDKTLPPVTEVSLYKVDIPEEAIPRMLDWDAPLSKQPESIKPILRNFLNDAYGDGAAFNASGISDTAKDYLMSQSNASAADIIRNLSKRYGDDVASKMLKEQGIPGIRYLDGSSRNVGEGTSNFVLFDDQLPRILEINGQPTGLLSYADEAKKAQSGLLENAPTPKDYGMEHRPPMRDSGAPLHDLTGGGTVYPDDILSSRAADFYGHYGNRDPMDMQTIGIIQSMKGNPKGIVEIYRAVPYEKSPTEQIKLLEKQLAKYMARDVVPSGQSKTGFYERTASEIERLRAIPEEKAGKLLINKGDWVTINKNYAKEHGESQLGGKYKIITKKVRAKDIYTNGDSIHEFGFDPD
jgi:hypothetical protein